MNADTLLHDIESAARAIGIAPTTLCQRAIGHSGLPKRLSGGGSVTLKTATKLREWIAVHTKRQRTTRRKAA